MKPDQYDSFLHTADWLTEREQPVALILVETLEPACGPDAVIFPPTYARRGGEHPYAISPLRVDSVAAEVVVGAAEKGKDKLRFRFPADGLSVQEAAAKGIEINTCDLDSVGSQANRMEPAFKFNSERPNSLASLVPQVVIKAGAQSVNLLDAGHRVADGAVRFSEQFGKEAAAAIESLAKTANAAALARLAPTSLVFGFWDSRNQDYQYKHPRILASTIRATNVAPIKRSAQFNPTFDPRALGMAPDEEPTEPAAAPDADAKDPLSKEGMRAAPAVDTHGGVRVFGRIVRRTEINLVALRSLAAVEGGKVNEAESLKLRRYIFGLALVAARYQSSYNLRQGCLLVGAEGVAPSAQFVLTDGKRKDFDWEVEKAYEFAKAAAQDFQVYSEEPTPRPFEFQSQKLSETIKLRAASGKGGKKATKA